MKQFTFFLLLGIAALTACREDDPVTLSPDASFEGVVLAGDPGSQATFTLTASTQWEITVDNDSFTAAPLKGGMGATTVTITSTRENTAPERRTIGTLTARARGGKTFSLPVIQRPATAPQTVLLYMPGRSLLSYYKKNIEDIREAINETVPGDSRLLVCYQPESHTTARIDEIFCEEVAHGCAVKTLRDYDVFSPSSAEDVARLLADVQDLAPAHRYGMIVGCHGKAWVPASQGSMPNMGPAAPGTIAPEAEPFGIPVPGALTTRSFGDPGHEIDIADFARAVASQNGPFDYVIFDACFMANIETLYDLRGAFDYVVASPCEILGAGFPYKKIIPYLFGQRGTQYNLEAVCKAYYDFYQHGWQEAHTEQSGCISLAVLSELDVLADVVRRLHATPTKDYDRNGIQSYEGMPTHIFYDLGDFVGSAYTDAALLDEFRERMEAAFPPACRLHTASFYSAYNGMKNPVRDEAYTGVTTSEPSTRYRVPFEQCNWYRATH